MTIDKIGLDRRIKGKKDTTIHSNVWTQSFAWTEARIREESPGDENFRRSLESLKPRFIHIIIPFPSLIFIKLR
jgi:hypothetical protein